MDCREFREKHIAYVDDTLPFIDMEAMERHRGRCPRCARHDTAVRRGLLIVHNLPEIRPSPGFSARLNARIQELQRAGATPPAYRPAHSVAAFSAIAAGVALAAGLALAAASRLMPLAPLRMPPVVASAPEMPPSPLANAALAATIPTGMPVWSAVLVADQAPMHLANLELREAVDEQ